jgi:hypothetical protein
MGLMRFFYTKQKKDLSKIFKLNKSFTFIYV